MDHIKYPVSPNSQTNPTLDFLAMSEKELEEVLAEHKIGLTPDEATKIQEILNRPPTLTEAIIWGIQGSEHCSYKSTRNHLKGFPTEGSKVILGPSEDAGIIEIANVNGKKYGIVIAHESHNQPSQVVPYEGAATGIGGVTRDILCMGAKVIATADPLRFGDINNPKSRIIANGVVDGISGYGNPIGVPNIGGDTYFSPDFDNNCLVNVVALGLLAEDEIIHSYAPKNSEGHAIILIGKPTDASGFGGAAFSSVSLDEDDTETNKGAVQEPNPFLKKHIFSATYDLFKKIKDKGMIDQVGFKDLGAGGIICASVELVEAGGMGAEIDLNKVHVAYPGLVGHILACSETQERLMWIVPQSIAQEVVNHYNNAWDLPDMAKGAGATIIGTVLAEERYTLTYNGETICNAKPSDITSGLLYNRPYKRAESKQEDVILDLSTEEIQALVSQMVAHENIASKKAIYEQYDKDIQGITVIESGEADAGVIAPLLNRFELQEEDQKTGVAFSVAGHHRYGKISAYAQAALAVTKGFRNVAAVGATPWCLTDCLNYRNPEIPEQMQEIVDGINGIKETLLAIPHKDFPEEVVPVISGNVSLYKDVSPSAIISMLGVMPDYSKAVKQGIQPIENSSLYLVGSRQKQLGGSVAFELLEKPLNQGVLPSVDPEKVRAESYGLIDAVQQGAVLSAHTISDGGMLTAILKMFFATSGLNMGGEFTLPENELTLAENLFSETGGFIVQVEDSNSEKFEQLLETEGAELFHLGKILANTDTVAINGVQFEIPKLEDIYANSLRQKLK